MADIASPPIPASDTSEKSIQSQYSHGPINILKQMWFYLAFSLLITIPGLIVMGMSIAHYPSHAPMRLGIDFTGGTMLQYGFVKPLNQDDILKMRDVLEKINVNNPIIQLQKAEKGMKGSTSNVTTQQTTADAPPKPAVAADSQSVTELFKDSANADKVPQDVTLHSVVSIRTQDLTTEKTIALQKH